MAFKAKMPVMGNANRKRWAKRLINVDSTKTNGYAFEGVFVDTGQPITVKNGELYMVYGERSSGSQVGLVRVYESTPKTIGSYGFEFLFRSVSLNRSKWALEVRDIIAKYVGLTYARNAMEESHGLVICHFTPQHNEDKIGYEFIIEGQDYLYDTLEEAVNEAAEMLKPYLRSKPEKTNFLAFMNIIADRIFEQLPTYLKDGNVALPDLVATLERDNRPDIHKGLGALFEENRSLVVYRLTGKAPMVRGSVEAPARCPHSSEPVKEGCTMWYECDCIFNADGTLKRSDWCKEHYGGDA